MRGLGKTATRYMEIQLVLGQSEREKWFVPRSVLVCTLHMLKIKNKKLEICVFFRIFSLLTDTSAKQVKVTCPLADTVRDYRLQNPHRM